MEIYERNINASVAKSGSKHITTKASLLDLTHNMRVEIKVHIKDRTIVEARAKMIKAPFKVCDQTTLRVEGLKGVKIDRGVTRRLKDIIGRNEGCTHLYELSVEAVRLSSNVLLGFEVGDDDWRERKLPDEVFIKKANKFLSNSCLPFKE